MRERPILFSAPMVRAILDGRKTQTRRVIKNVPRWDHYGQDIMDWDLSGIHQEDDESLVGTDRWFLDVQCDVDDHSREVIRCPYGAPGDRLWVRETWTRVPSTAYRGSVGVQQAEDPSSAGMAAVYAAGWERSTPGRWRPSIHMPRWASRIDIEVTAVRVERLQACSEADAEAEGADASLLPDLRVARRSPMASLPAAFAGSRDLFATLWESINGAGSWDANPLVWVVEFRRVRP